MKSIALILRVELHEVVPKIWRRVVVPGDLLLSDIHHVIQALFGWEDAHLWQFSFGKNIYSLPDEDMDDFLPGGQTQNDAGDTTLLEALGARKKFGYTYDFGDNWEVNLMVEQRVESARRSVPVCTDGIRAGPPDDTGGPPGYENLCEVLADPDHPEYAEMRDWIGDEWNPEAFDIDAINLCLKRGFAGLK